MSRVVLGNAGDEPVMRNSPGTDNTSSNFSLPRSPAIAIERSRASHISDPRMAAEQRVAAPNRVSERLRQLPLPTPPPREHFPVLVLERDRGDAALVAAAA